MRNNFARLTPRELEKLSTDFFRKMCGEVKSTPYVKDYRADVIAGEDDMWCSSKHSRRHNVGGEVQRTLRMTRKHGANKAVFITSSNFYPGSGKAYKGVPIELRIATDSPSYWKEFRSFGGLVASV